MREEILKLLKDGKQFHEEIIANYSDVLTPDIIEGANYSIQDIPNRVNEIINILNHLENDNQYNLVGSIDEAIGLFEDEDIQVSIDSANDNQIAVGYVLLNAARTNITAEEALISSKSIIEIAVRTLHGQLMTGRLKSGRL